MDHKSFSLFTCSCTDINTLLTKFHLAASGQICYFLFCIELFLAYKYIFRAIVYLFALSMSTFLLESHGVCEVCKQAEGKLVFPAQISHLSRFWIRYRTKQQKLPCLHKEFIDYILQNFRSPQKICCISALMWYYSVAGGCVGKFSPEFLWRNER